MLKVPLGGGKSQGKFASTITVASLCSPKLLLGFLRMYLSFNINSVDLFGPSHLKKEILPHLPTVPLTMSLYDLRDSEVHMNRNRDLTINFAWPDTELLYHVGSTSIRHGRHINESI